MPLRKQKSQQKEMDKMEREIAKICRIPREDEEGWKVKHDWRPYLAGIRNQENCCCCWAMAAIAAMEGIIKKNTGETVILSPQDLINELRKPRDTKQKVGQNGCYNNDFQSTFKFIQKFGVQHEKDCPFLAKRTDEIPPRSENLTKIDSYAEISPKNEQLMENVLKQSPILGILEDCDELHSHKEGIYMGPKKAKSSPQYHAVLIVARAIDSNGVAFWICLNSWGVDWGEKGFFRVPCRESNKDFTKFYKKEPPVIFTTDTNLVYPVITYN